MRSSGWARAAARADGVSKGAGVAADGHGYNPYRDKGKFAAGPHKQKPKTGHAAAAIAVPTARRSGTKAESAASAAPRAHGALAKAKEAAAVARAKPTKENIQAAKQAVGDAAKAAGLRTAKARPGARASARSEKSGSPKSPDVSRLVASDPRRQLSIEHNTDTADGRTERQFTPESQHAIRGHMNDVIARYGMSSRDAGLHEAGVLEVRTAHAMAGAAAQHYQQTGKIVLDEGSASALASHGQHDPRELGRRLTSEDRNAEKMVGAYRVATHEAVHGHGPLNDYSSHGVMLEELSTEMSARKITADAHGLSVWDVRTVGSYTHYISPTVSALSDISGKSRAEAHEALSQASLEYKRSGTTQAVEPTGALRSLGASALRHLGVHNEAHVDALHAAMLGASEGV